MSYGRDTDNKIGSRPKEREKQQVVDKHSPAEHRIRNREDREFQVHKRFWTSDPAAEYGFQ
jgi:hypothetical protein